MKAKNRQKYYIKYGVIIIFYLNLQFHVHKRTPVSKCNHNFVLLRYEHKTSVLQTTSQTSNRKTHEH